MFNNVCVATVFPWSLFSQRWQEAHQGKQVSKQKKKPPIGSDFIPRAAEDTGLGKSFLSYVCVCMKSNIYSNSTSSETTTQLGSHSCPT